jgi:hypothetical protein
LPITVHVLYTCCLAERFIEKRLLNLGL